MEKEWQKGRKNICLRLQAYVIHQIEFSYTFIIYKQSVDGVFVEKNIVFLFLQRHKYSINV